MTYWRPIPQSDPARPGDALPLAVGPLWFTQVAQMERGRAPRIVPARDVPAEVLDRLTGPRAPVAGLGFERARIMAILNVTPDSFSDGGRFDAPAVALARALALIAEGADVLDIGGESTRPGAPEVPFAVEITRTAPAIAAIRAAQPGVPISIDTRKAAVAGAALQAGADIVNDVAAMRFDPGMPALVAQTGAPVVLMHHIGTPETMQADPRYEDVVLDVYDWLADAVAKAEAAGIARERLILDPGIGFGKTVAHNVTLLRHLALYHGLGCPLLVGASRKGFVGALSGEADPAGRMAGSVAVALFAAAQGAQILRVHDVRETRQALNLQEALSGI